MISIPYKKASLHTFYFSLFDPLKLISVITICLFSNLLFAQSDITLEKLDSLKSVLHSSSIDSIKGKAFITIANTYRFEVSGGLDSVLYYASKGAEFNKKKKFKVEQAKCMDILGMVYRDKLDKTKSRQYYEDAHDIFITIGDTTSALKSKGSLATSLISFGEVEEAIKIKLENIESFTVLKDSTALMIEYYGVGNAISSTQSIQKAIPYFLKASTFNDHPLVLGTIGRNYSAIGKVDSAFYYVRKGLDIAQAGSGFETDLIQKLGSVYFENDQFSESIVEFEKALKAMGNDSNSGLGVRIKNNLTYAYIQTGQITKARKLFNKIAVPTDNKMKLARHYEIKYKLLKAEKNYKDAFQAHIDFSIAKDSIASTTLRSSLEDIKVKYESEKKDVEIENLAIQSELKNKVVSRQKRMITFSSIAMGAFALLSFFLYRLYKQVKSQKTVISKALSEKDLLLREIHHRVKNNLQLVSSLLTLQGKSIDDEVALQAINDGKSRVRSMALIHKDLYNKENLTGIGVKKYIEDLTQELYRTYAVDTDQVELKMNVQDMELDVDTLVPLGLIINELITNCLKYAFPDRNSGTLEITLNKEDEKLILNIIDNGVGYNQSSVRDRSFGSTLINSLTAQLKGELTIDSDNGTNIKIVMENYI